MVMSNVIKIISAIEVIIVEQKMADGQARSLFIEV